MARILGIDFGTKRVGIAVTDPLQLIVNPLVVKAPEQVIPFLREYLASEDIELIVCGEPGIEYASTRVALDRFVVLLKEAFPGIPVVFQDEHLTSHKASGIILRSGVPKMKRRDKALVDSVSAVLILQEYLGHLGDVHLS